MGHIAVSHMALGFVLNGPALMKIFHAFQTGGRCRTGAEDVLPEAFLFDPNDLIHEIEADFSRQGPRELIALLCGHEHIDAVHSDHGYPEVSFLSSLCYRNSPEAPERRFGTAGEQAWSMVALNRTARRLNVFRYGPETIFRSRIDQLTRNRIYPEFMKHGIINLNFSTQEERRI